MRLLFPLYITGEKGWGDIRKSVLFIYSFVYLFYHSVIKWGWVVFKMATYLSQRYSLSMWLKEHKKDKRLSQKL